MNRVSRDLSQSTCGALELYECELSDLAEILGVSLEDEPAAETTLSVRLSVGHWRCISAALGALLSSAKQVERESSRDAINNSPNNQAKSLVERLREGCVWSSCAPFQPALDEVATESLMAEAASHIEAVEGEKQALWVERGEILRDAGADEFDLLKRLEAAEHQLDLLRAERDEWKAKWANLKADRDLWPLEVREAIDRLEDEHDVSICSGQHLAVWVDRTEAAEKEAALLRAELDAVYQDRARDTIKATEQIVGLVADLKRKEEALREIEGPRDANLSYVELHHESQRIARAARSSEPTDGK